MPGWTEQRVIGRPQTVRGRRVALAIGAASIAPFLINVFADPGPFINEAWLAIVACLIPGFAAFSCFVKADQSPTERLAWQLIGAGITLGTIGAVGRFFMLDVSGGRPVPAWVDPFFLALYPSVLTGLMLVLRNRLRTYRYMAFFDSTAGFLLLCVFCLTLFPDQVQSFSEHDDLATAILMFYPIGDICLLVMVGVLFLGTSSLREGPWLSFGIGIGLFALADLYFAFNLPTEGPTFGLLTVLWLSCFLFMIYGTWRPEGEVTELAPGVVQLVLPLTYICLIIGVLIWDRWHEVRTSAVIALACAFVIVMVRLVLTAREYSLTFRLNEKQYIDALTRLPSRAQLDLWLEEASPHSHSHSGHRSATVVAIVIDRLAHYESSLGPAAADQIISKAATRVRRSASHLGRVAILERGEFILLCTGQDSPNPKTLAEQLFQGFERPVRVGGIRLKLTITVGISSSPSDTDDPHELPRLALISCQEARNKDSTLQISPSDPERGRKSLQLTEELRAAISEGQLRLHFQPKVRTNDREVSSVEALVRWQHPVEGLLGPGRFVPIAEESGVAAELTDAVTELAVRQLSEWRDRGISLRVSVNLGMSNLLDDSLHDRLISILHRHEVQTTDLILEVSEDLIMSRGDILIPNLWRLRESAFTISMDDFGSGTTSLSHLKSLPLDEMKIDRSLIGRMHESHASSVIVEAAMEIGKGLGLNVVAEGAEEQRTVEMLIDGGKCDEIQSFYYARPMPAEALDSWLQEFRSRSDAKA